MNELEKKTYVGSMWSLIERFGYLGIQFISNIVLARLLMPSDFGVIGILLVFTNLSAVLIDSGFASALIQKKQINDKDVSTVFYTNICISIIVYIVIYITAPYVSIYFNNPNLTKLLRVIELIVVIDAFAAIQSTLLNKEMNFKRLTRLKISAIFIAVVISIFCALIGLGVWSLVIQYLVFSLFRTIFLWFGSKWKPIMSFSLNSFRSLFNFGVKLLFSQLISELYINFQSILIGRFFNSRILGFYTQAKQLQQVPVSALSTVVNTVSFPAYAQLQDSKEELVSMLRKNVKILVSLNTPLMFFLSIVAKPLIVILYSEKWIESVPYFQFLCLGFGVLLIIHSCCLTALKAIGRSDYVLYLEIIKKVVGIFLLLLGLHFYGIWGIMIALTINSIIEIFLNGYFMKKEINYGAVGVIKDFLPALILSFIVGGITYISVNCIVDVENNLLNVLMSFIIYLVLYICLTFAFKFEISFLIKAIIKRVINK